jgi:Zinc carboxypeptidase
MFTRRRRSWRPLLLPVVLAAFVAAPVHAQGKLTTPKEFFGHNIGDDYWLPTYDQFSAYWHKLAGETNRMHLLEIGKSAEGRTQLAAIVTAPENFAKLARYKQIAKSMHDAKGIDSTMARAMAKEGKAVVWIDGGLHATEVLGANQLIETNWQLVSRNDDETMRILKDVIVVMVHANPDGMQMVAKQYMSYPDSLARRVGSPRLYEKYAGHDNNRDFYMSNLPESQNMNKLMYWEWDPQIMYNHHQTGPAGTVIFSPPFRDPFNYNFDPMIVMGLDMVGAAMHQRFLQEGKPGFTMRSGSSYSTWWNGGLRTTAYFQNIIGILTESIGNPTPENIPAIIGQMLPRGDLPAPIEPQTWHFRQSIDYSVTANYAILDLAQRYKDQFLYNIWKMGSNQIARGSRDYWTISEEDIARADSAIRPAAAIATGRGRGAATDVVIGGDAGPVGGGGGRGGRGGMTMEQYNAVMKDPARRDPRAFIVTSSQADFATATKFINSLRYIGVEINRTTAPLTVAGKSYPVGSYVINTAQAGRAHVMDMFMPQDHPNDFAYPGGPPVRPYDNAGWTVAYQMGVQFDAVQETVAGPLQLIDGLAKPMAGKVTPPQAGGGYLLSPAQNDAFTVVNRLLKAGGDVWRSASAMTANGKTYGPGSFYVVATGTTTPIINTGAAELGVDADGTMTKPGSDAFKVVTHRIALYDSPTGSQPSGWTRYVLERFEFPFDVACGGTFDAADFRSKYDVIVLPDGSPTGAVGGGGRGGGGRGGAGGGGRGGAPGGAGARPVSNDPDLAPACVPGAGANPTADTYRKFLESGGIVVAAGTASGVGGALGLPLKDYLVSRAPGEADKHLTGDDYFVPGSILRAAVDTKSIATAGMPDHIDIFYKNDPVYRLLPDAGSRNVKPIVWFDTDKPLRSGWAWGQNYLEGGTVGIEAAIGTGKLFMFSPDITFRGQPHESFKFLFNSIYSK